MAAISVFVSPSAQDRIDEAHRFVDSYPPSTEFLCVGASREAADDFVRDVSARRGATFGLHRFSLNQLAVRVASTELARQGLAPSTRLGTEAVAARATFEALQAEALRYLWPVARCKGFAGTLAATLSDLRLGRVDTALLAELGDPGRDLRELALRFGEQLAAGRIADRAGLFGLATRAIRNRETSFDVARPILLLDVAVDTLVERAFVAALATVSPDMLATVPAGDDRTRIALASQPRASVAEPSGPADDGPLTRLRQYLFTLDVPAGSSRAATGEPGTENLEPRTENREPGTENRESAVSFFSAPGEGRECVEIARRVLDAADRGIRFDRIAILLRAPLLYAGLLETALHRAGVPAWFARGTSSPDPAGRAFLALLACAAENLSARRFSEYLSLGQVPELDPAGGPPTDREVWVAPADQDEVLSVPKPAEWGQLSLFPTSPPEPVASVPRGRSEDSDDAPVLAGTLRAPWNWDRLLVESAVIGGRDRWARRLEGLARELRVKWESLRDEESESPRVARLERDRRNLDHLRRFALPVIDVLASLPSAAAWSEWLVALERLAPMVLQDPERVLAVLAELHPMAAIGPVALEEVRDVLSERLSLIQDEPPTRRYGRVFIGTAEQARGRVFDVIFVPGLAERIFPQKPREDSMLLDASRMQLNAALSASTAAPAAASGEEAGVWRGARPLPTQGDRASRERLLLRLAVGAASSHLSFSYPRMELGEARPRVPSFYALDVERAKTGRVPDFRDFEREAFAEAGARLAWPAPRDPGRAIDDTEYDLAVLLPLLHHAVPAEVKGRGRYLLELSLPLSRSLRTRWARWTNRWSEYDGLYKPGAAARQALGRHRLSARPYSVSALQKFAICPYQFLLSAIYRLEPREDAIALEQMDPLTRGHMFHRVQADLMRELQKRGALPVTSSSLSNALDILDRTLNTVAEQYRENLAPAIERVWRDEVEAMRGDLRGWLQRVVGEAGVWEPIRAEFGFGFPPGEGRDPDSVREPVTLDGRWKLHGVVDLVERRRGADELRVTDHKTGANWTKDGMVVGGGELLQPVLYGLAVEAAMQVPVTEARLSYCTSKGGFTERVVLLKEEALTRARRRGIEVLEIVDRAIEQGTLMPSPRDGACRWCDFHEVCGPWEEVRVKRKDPGPLGDLTELRGMP